MMRLAEFRNLVVSAVFAAVAFSAFAQTVDLAAGSSSCRVDLDGARVVSFRCRGEEVLWNANPPQKGAADWAHGGIPLCWPRFGVDSSGAIHGVAWRRPFALLRRCDLPGRCEAVLGLVEGDASLEVAVVLSDGLSLEMKTTNRGTNTVSCSFGFHPYLRVAESANAVLYGVDGLPFEDDPSCHRPQRGVWKGTVRFLEPIDRIFRLAEPKRASFALHDVAGGRRIVVESEGASHLNVWNPGAEKNCPGTVPGDEWRRFACVEPVFMGGTDGAPLPVPPGESRTLRLTVRVEAEGGGQR